MTTNDSNDRSPASSPEASDELYGFNYGYPVEEAQARFDGEFGAPPLVAAFEPAPLADPPEASAPADRGIEAMQRLVRDRLVVTLGRGQWRSHGTINSHLESRALVASNPAADADPALTLLTNLTQEQRVEMSGLEEVAARWRED